MAKVVHLESHPETHAKLKAHCKKHKISMKDFVSNLILGAVDRQK